MGKPHTRGRMINREISDSKKFASLSSDAAVLFCLIIPHLNSHGKLNGGAGFIKDAVCPLIPYLTPKKIEKLLTEINDKTNIKWFEHEGRFWIHAIKFLSDHQTLDKEKLGSDELPNYSGTSPELLRSKSGVSPEQVVAQVEGEVKGEVKGKALSGKPDFTIPIIYLNEKIGSNFSIDLKSTNIKFVKARFAEGRTFEDFKKVIDLKCAEWLTNEKMAQYLRPATLFNATKFESYLNQPAAKEKSGLDAYMTDKDEKPKPRYFSQGGNRNR